MLNKAPTRFMLTFFLAFLLLLAVTGCGTEEEAYEMDSDEEFQQAVDNAVERFLYDDDPNVILNDLYESYSERYSEEEIEEYVMVRVEEETERVNTKLEELELSITEAADKADQLKEQLKNETDEDTWEDITKKLEPMYKWIEKLNADLEETADPGRIIDLMQEKINTYNELATIIEEKLDSDRPNISNNQEARDLINYYHDIEDLLEKERGIISAYEGVTGDNFISDRLLHDELRRNIIPDTEGLIDELRKVSTESEDVEELHILFTETWELKLEGFQEMAKAINEDDEDKKDEAEALLEEGSLSREQFLDQLDQLY